jgi:predicted metalloprotease
MEWEDREESENVEDRRTFGPKTLVVGGGVGAIVIVILGLVFGFDLGKITEIINPGAPQGGADQTNGQQTRPVDPEEEKLASFSKVVFHDTEVIWDELFRKMGKQYHKPVLVLYSGRVDSACGLADAAVGPFYCPGDAKVYLDLSFFRDMQRKLNAPGEFARAYVIAHEVGHHVQGPLGYSQRVHEARSGSNKAEANKMSVRLELQADFFAGVWAYHAQKRFHFLQKGDVASALHAAFEIGDDRLQNKARGHVVPDSFTHGTSRQRMRWFKEGFEKGDVSEARALFDLRYDEL